MRKKIWVTIFVVHPVYAYIYIQIFLSCNVRKIKRIYRNSCSRVSRLFKVFSDHFLNQRCHRVMINFLISGNFLKSGIYVKLNKGPTTAGKYKIFLRKTS